MSLFGSQYWTEFPVAQEQHDTDLCSKCGHTRWLHAGKVGLFSSNPACKVARCGCAGTSYYHIAKCVGPFDTVTDENTLGTVTINQPAPPGQPLEQ